MLKHTAKGDFRLVAKEGDAKSKVKKERSMRAEKTMSVSVVFTSILRVIQTI